MCQFPKIGLVTGGYTREKNIPTKQKTTQDDARLSEENEHCERKKDNQQPSQERSQTLSRLKCLSNFPSHQGCSRGKIFAAYLQNRLALWGDIY